MTTSPNDPAGELEELENQRDALLLQLARMEQANEEAVPIALAKRLSAGENPVRVWREHRTMSQEALAAAASLPPSLIASIELGQEAKLSIMQTVARALRVDLDDLVPWSREQTALSGHSQP